MRKLVRRALALAVVLALAAAGWLWLERDSELVSAWRQQAEERLGPELRAGREFVLSWLERGGELLSTLLEQEAGVSQPAAAQPGAPPPTPVETAEVRTGAATEEIIVAGSLRAMESVRVSSEIAGLISAIHFGDAEPAEAGQLLFELEDSIARAELAQAEAQLALAESNHRRAAELLERQVGTERTRDEAVAALETARADVGLARARLEKTQIKAPFDGLLGLRTVSVGEYVTPGQELVNLEDIEPIKVDFRVAERFLQRLQTGQPVRIRVESLPDRTFAGAVTAIDPHVDQETRSVAVRAEVPNEERLLRPGQFARVTVVVEERDDALLVPEQALLPRGSDFFVYKVVDGKALMVQVETGRRRAGNVEIVSGLSAGDVIVTGGHQKIRDGAPVEPVPGGEVS
ncbi:MAG TPA: efflux RND transporter periplasmic adaptor subunit [Afifellaceae bacterium]|nr:efflux RND transporter periplasmic adaptor subunit [Afifellaceae bacterium]